MRVLIYEAMPDILRADVILGIAAEYIERGHDVFLLLDEDVHLLTRNSINEPHIISCRNIIRSKIASSGIPFFATPKSAQINRTFLHNPGKKSLEHVQDFKADYHRKILETFHPDKIVIWNGLMAYQSGLINLAKNVNPRQGFTFLESGWFPQKGTYYSDPQGVNAASSIANTTPPSLNKEQTLEIENWKKSYREAHGNYETSDKNYLFIPLQLESDTNITLFSPFKTMRDFLVWVIDNTPPDISIIARPHPLSSGNPKQLYLSPRLRLDSKTPLQKLIAESHAVVGINSTVLLESLIYEKPTIALGQGLFQNSGAIYLQDINTQLPNTQDWAFSMPPNKKPLGTREREAHTTRKQNALLFYLKRRQSNLPAPKRFKASKIKSELVPTTTYSKASQVLSTSKIILKQLIKRI